MDMLESQTVGERLRPIGRMIFVWNNFESVVSRRALCAWALRELCRATLARIASVIVAECHGDQNEHIPMKR
jgi:hypothetical protein